MAENEQLLPLFLFFSLFLYLIPYPSDSLPLPSPARLSTLRRFSRLGDRCSRAPTEDHACVASCSGHNACVHARMVRHATKREIIPRAACGPFVIRPYRRGGTNTRTKREGGRGTQKGTRARLARHASKTAARGLSPAYLPTCIVACA